jgi:rubrerythrin
MDEYIRRTDAINSVYEAFADGKNAYDALNAIPVADVRPVARGTWVGIDDFPHDDWECDHCGCVVENTNDPWNYYHFCPNCGADMREKAAE